MRHFADAAHGSEIDHIEGVIERISFYKPHTGFLVAKVRVDGFFEPVNVVGVLGGGAHPGEKLLAWGAWVFEMPYGNQFKAHRLQVERPIEMQQIEKYLGSGVIPGVGPELSGLLVKTFGPETLRILDEESDLILKVKQIGPVRGEAIRRSWRQGRLIRDLMIFLQGHGLSTQKAYQINRVYGKQAIEKIRAEPYDLAKEISGIGFQTADLLATRLGISRDSPIRIRAGLHFVLNEKLREGHCAFPEGELMAQTARLLNLSEDALQEALDKEVGTGLLSRERIDHFACICVAAMTRLEESVAQRLSMLAKGVPSTWSGLAQFEVKLKDIEKTMKLSLAPLQKLAIHTALSQKVTVITGGPGTGKSTLVRGLVSYLKQLRKIIFLAAPTGRAARRLSEGAKHPAYTIHRLLAQTIHQDGDRLEADMIIVDEASMVDLPLAHRLLSAIGAESSLVFVGDADQLSSVGPGQFLSDLIQAEVVPVVRLSQIFRQSSQSQITLVAHQINRGEFPDLAPHRQDDFFFLEAWSPERAKDLIVDLVVHRIPKAYPYNPIRDIQVLSPMNKGVLGVRSLNAELQRALNCRSHEGTPEKIEAGGLVFCVGDKVMVTENDYQREVFNGDIGLVDQINEEEAFVTIAFDDRFVRYDYTDLDLLQPAFAITIHKSQGSEYPVVVLPLFLEHSRMLQKRLIYTAITRGRNLVVIVGQRKALALALSQSRQFKRWTQLKDRLRTAFV